jgi:glycosyltransferase involved in cell wall biosynthesis
LVHAAGRERLFNDAIRLEQLPGAGVEGRKVLFVTNMWPDEERPYYGSFIASQARSLAEAGTSVDTLYVRGYLGAQAYARAVLALPRVARARPYDLVHAHYGHTALASILLRRRPLVVSFCGGDLLGEPAESGRITHKSRLEVAVFRQVARTATVTITKSDEMARALPHSLRERNYVLPNGVDLDAFSPRPRDVARAELGWEHDGKIILFLGNPDDPRKNVALAKKASEIVRRTIPSARLHVAWGIGPEEVPHLMNAADCLLFTSRSEGSPNVVKEAMACALPIVATPVGDVPERLHGVKNCFICEPSVEPIAEAVIQALDCDRAPEARAAVEALGIGLVADRLEHIYNAARDLHLSKREVVRDLVEL